MNQPHFITDSETEYLVVQIHFSNYDGKINLIVTDEPFDREKDSYKVVWERAHYGEDRFCCVTNNKYKGTLIWK